MKVFTPAIVAVLLLGCTASPSTTEQLASFEFVKGEGAAGIDLVFDRRTGCLSEVQRYATADEFMNASPTEANQMADRLKPENRSGAPIALHGGVASFGGWKCPAALKAEGAKSK